MITTRNGFNSLSEADLKAIEDNCMVLQGYDPMRPEKEPTIIVGLLKRRRGNVLIMDDNTHLANRPGCKWQIFSDHSESILADCFRQLIV